jgi:hypothetical protein
MKKFKMVFGVFCLMTLAPDLGAQTPVQDRPAIHQESPPNLGKLKLQLIGYHDCVHSNGVMFQT